MLQQIDWNLFHEDIKWAAEGFLAARLSTFVMPVLQDKKQMGYLKELPEWPQLQQLIAFAKPYIEAGGDFRHGATDVLFPQPNASDTPKSPFFSSAKSNQQQPPTEAIAAAAAVTSARL